jgi:cytochrome c biogenesis protein CcmG/thiol:disulfide interchange protein DsbE
VKRWIAWVALVPFAALLGVSLWLLTRPQPPPSTSIFASPVRPAPEFDVAGLDGGRVKLADFKGRPVMFNFWGSYCAPCKEEHPVLMDMAAQGVEIVGLLFKDPDPDAARAILKNDGNPFRQVAVDPDGDLGLDVGISGVPESFLIDASGTIVKTIRGPLSNPGQKDEMMAAWKKELAQAHPAGG